MKQNPSDPDPLAELTLDDGEPTPVMYAEPVADRELLDEIRRLMSLMNIVSTEPDIYMNRNELLAEIDRLRQWAKYMGINPDYRKHK